MSIIQVIPNQFEDVITSRENIKNFVKDQDFIAELKTGLAEESAYALSKETIADRQTRYRNWIFNTAKTFPVNYTAHQFYKAVHFFSETFLNDDSTYRNKILILKSRIPTFAETLHDEENPYHLPAEHDVNYLDRLSLKKFVKTRLLLEAINLPNSEADQFFPDNIENAKLPPNLFPATDTGLIDFKLTTGVCAGLCHQFILYFLSASPTNNPVALLETIAKRFQEGADPRACIAQAIMKNQGNTNKDLLGIEKKIIKHFYYTDLENNTEKFRKNKNYLNYLKPGSYYVSFYTGIKDGLDTRHDVAMFKIHKNLAFLWDPNKGLLFFQGENHINQIFDFLSINYNLNELNPPIMDKNSGYFFISGCKLCN